MNYHAESFLIQWPKFLAGIFYEALLTTAAMRLPAMSMSLNSVSLLPLPSASRIAAKHLISANWLLELDGAPSLVVDLPTYALYPSPKDSSFQKVTTASLAEAIGTGATKRQTPLEWKKCLNY